MALKFLIDECLGLSLAALAHQRSYEAYHVAHRGLAQRQDHELLPLLLQNEWILVTNNARDFKGLLDRKDAVHPGLVVVMTQVRPSAQRLLFEAVLVHLDGRSELINRVIEVDVDDTSKAVISQNERMTDEAWKEIEANLRPQVKEFALP